MKTFLNIQGAGECTNYHVTFFSFPTSKEWNTASISNSSVANSSVAKKDPVWGPARQSHGCRSLVHKSGDLDPTPGALM